MRSSFYLLSIILITAFATNRGNALQIDSVDYPIAPPGQTVTVTGSGFTGVSKVSLAKYTRIERIANFQVIDDLTLQFVMPSLPTIPEGYCLILDNGVEATVALPDSFSDYNAGDPAPYSNHPFLRVKAGATLDSAFRAEILYVETGGAVEVVQGRAEIIIAEAGAYVSFEEETWRALVHAPDSIIVGPTQRFAMETSGDIEANFGLPPINIGYPINVNIIGQGSVAKSPDQPFYTKNRDGDVTLLATPAEGYFFAGWTGYMSSSDPTLIIDGDDFLEPVEITATFNPGFTLEVVDIHGADVSSEPALDIYPNGSEITLIATAEPGYEVLGWGGDARADSVALTFTISGNMRVWPIVKKSGYESLPTISSVQHSLCVPSAANSLAGEGLANATKVTLFNQFSNASSQAISASNNEVNFTFPDISSSNHLLLLETVDGATITWPNGALEYDGSQSPTSQDRLIIVKSGHVLAEPNAADFIYLETGAMINRIGIGNADAIIAENGAIVDVTGSMFFGKIIHCPETIFIGSPRFPIAVTTAIGLSTGIDYLEEGYEVDVSVIGNGSVILDPNQSYYKRTQYVTITAIPSPGASFFGWSGDLSSSELVQRIRLYGSQYISATFTEDWLLDVASPDGVTITKSPDKAFYDDGEVVTLTATPDQGMEFLGWIGDADNLSASITITIGEHMELTPIVRPLGYDSLPQVVSINNLTPDAGETVIFSGARLDNLQSVKLYSRHQQNLAEANEISDQAFEIIMPALSPDLRHTVLIETSDGATVLTSPNAEIYEDITPMNRFTREVIVPFGKTMTSGYNADFIYVEAGGKLNLSNSGLLSTIIVEDGGILEISENSNVFAMIIHSPGATIIGESQRPIIELPVSIRRSPNVPTFLVGYPLNLIIEGPGAVSISPDKELYERSEKITLTASPDQGAHFIRWSGSVTGRDLTENISASGSMNVIARFSNNPNYFIDWRLTQFTLEQLADNDISGLDANPDGDVWTNAAEYAFGLDPNVADGEDRVGMRSEPYNGDQRLLIYFIRPTTASDIEYTVEISSDLTNWRYNGDGLGEIVTEEISVEPIGDDLEKVTVEIKIDIEGVVFTRIDTEILDSL